MPDGKSIMYKTAFLICLCGSLSYASYYYSGYVRNKNAAAISGATVTLSGTANATQSTAGGAFLLTGSTTAARPPLQPAAAGPSIKLAEVGKNRIVIYSLHGQPAHLVLYDLSGRIAGTATAAPGKSAALRFRFSGCHIAQATCGAYRSTFKLMGLGGRIAGEKTVFLNSGSLRSAGGTAKLTAAGSGADATSLVGTLTGYYPGSAWVYQDTMTGIVITLMDTASYQSGPAYLNPSLSFEQRVRDLISRLTLDEKGSLMNNTSDAVSRLSIPAYDWWNEALHGVARSGLATSFPTPTGIAATFDSAAIYEMASIISTEGRAKYHNYLAQGQGGQMNGGITYWSPIVDIARDPRWGRVLETFGEDPLLVSLVADGFIRGLQGNDPRYLKAAATAKHFAAHAGPDVGRSTFNAVVTIRDLQDTYFPSFMSAIRTSNVEAVMCAYIRVNGVYSCSNRWLLDTMLRRTWGFDGHVVSDCGATAQVQAGCDIGCNTYTNIASLVRGGSLSEALVDTALFRTLMTRFKLGMFDPQQMVQYSSIPLSIVNCSKHIAHARAMSRKSIVLLRNRSSTLPLSSGISTIAVVGPNANPPATNDTLNAVMLGNYYGYPADVVPVLEGIIARATLNGATVNYVLGCGRTGTNYSGFAAAVTAAQNADVTVAVMGLGGETQNPNWGVVLEGENMDRTDLRLPTIQDSLLKRLVATGKPVIAVLLNGGSLSIDYAARNVSAILEAWYPGEQGGNAVADVLFGDYNPAGRLPLTYYRASTVFPDISVMAMTSRTYRYYSDTVLYPFGFGLSYTTFSYSNLQIMPSTATTGSSVTLQVDVTNTGARDGDEVVQVYVTDVAASVAVPIRSLVAFKRVPVGAGRTVTVSFALPPKAFSIVDATGRRIVEPGAFTVLAGGGQPVAVDGAVPPSQNGTMTMTGSVYVITP
jgi:beta-glucosidase